jgi:uncharacterized damage-inducible protein DinB
MKLIPFPNELHYAMYYEDIIKLVDKNISVLQQLKDNAKLVETLLKSLSEEQLQYKYAEEKWCIKDILQHIVDIERLLSFRGMNFVRQNKTPQQWIDENAFATSAEAYKKPLRKILAEYKTQRTASIAFYKNLSHKELKRCGIASNFDMSVSATLFIICGHELHHLQIIKERYLG